MTENLDVRFSCKMHGVRLEDLARALSVSESTLYRRLRRPLMQEERARFLEAIAHAQGKTEEKGANHESGIG